MKHHERVVSQNFEGPVSYYADESEVERRSDFQSIDEALSFAAAEDAPNVSPLRITHNHVVAMDGDFLKNRLAQHRTAQLVYELIRTDPRKEEMDLELTRLSWDPHGARYAFSGYGPAEPKLVTFETLAEQPARAIADSVLQHVKMEIEFRKGTWGH